HCCYRLAAIIACASLKLRYPTLSCVFPDRSFICDQLTTAMREQHCGELTCRPTGMHVHLHLRQIGADRPCRANTARHVFMIAVSTGSPGSIPAVTGM